MLLGTVPFVIGAMNDFERVSVLNRMEEEESANALRAERQRNNENSFATYL